MVGKLFLITFFERNYRYVVITMYVLVLKLLQNLLCTKIHQLLTIHSDLLCTHSPMYSNLTGVNALSSTKDDKNKF